MYYLDKVHYAAEQLASSYRAMTPTHVRDTAYDILKLLSEDTTRQLLIEAVGLLQVKDPEARKDPSWEKDRVDFIKKFDAWYISQDSKEVR